VRFRISVLAVAVSMLTMFVAWVFPHHHHDGIVCVVMDLCEEDGILNDEHTDHSCAAEADFTIPHSDDDAKGKLLICPDHAHEHLPLFSVLYLMADVWSPMLDESLSDSDLREHFLPATAVEASRIRGLRAPPILFS
jgi:hypothetical protein